jgi:PAS domain S-box-containing protein
VEELAQCGTWIWTASPPGLELSEGLHRLLGLQTADAAVSPGLQDELLFERQSNPVQSAAKLFAGQIGTDGVTFRVKRPDGSLRWLRAVAIPLATDNGQQVVGIVRDVTDLVAAHQRADGYQLWLSALCELFEIDLWKADAWSRIIDRFDRPDSPMQERLLGEGPARMDRIHPEDRALALEREPRQTPRGRVQRRFRLLMGDGQYSTVTTTGLGMQPEGSPSAIWVGYSRLSREDGSPVDDESPALRGGLLRAARAYANWSIAELATRSGVSGSTIRRIESSSEFKPRIDNIEALWGALAKAGIARHRGEDGGMCLRLIRP